MNKMRVIFLVAGISVAAISARAQDAGQLPQNQGAPQSSVAPSSQALPTTTADQPGDVTLTPENPVSNNPLPPIPKLELNTSDQYAPVLPDLNAGQNGLYEPTIEVKAYEFTGNTVYDSDTLAHLIDKYAGRKVTSEELEAARQILTLYYVNHGYINSGAILPDQDPKDGIIHFQIVEGQLTTVEVTGNHWFQGWWLRNEMRQAAGSPLNFNKLKEGMQVLRENSTIAQVNAELQPGGAPGESQLKMEVKDAQPFRFSVEVNNYRPPSVGSTIAEAHLSDLNLTGNNDPLSLTYGIATSSMGSGYEFSGFDNVGADYRFPITPWRTTMEIGADKNNSSLIEAPFNQLDIQSKLTEYHLSIHQPVFETPKRSLILSAEIDSRRSETFLFGQPFTLSSGANNGVEDVFVPRFIQEFVDRSQVHVFSFRSQFSYGINGFRSTINPGPPDGHFFDWLGQAQYIRRLGTSDCLVIGRLSGQIADRPLLSIEQLELGGISSVRGYLENQVLTDNGILASLEVRIPILEDKDKNSIISLAPFSDFGVGWDNVEVGATTAADGSTSVSDRNGVTLPSAGVGILLNPVKYISGQLYWGYGFNRRQVPDGTSLQNQGIEFSVSFNAL